MFERFTDRARKVVVLSQEEARALQHNYIGTEHLLLGLIGEAEGVGGQALSSLGATSNAYRAAVGEMVGLGAAEPGGHIPFTPRCKKSLELSLRAALRLKHDYISTEHLLLGILMQKESVAVQVLAHEGLTRESVAAAVTSAMGVEAFSLDH